VEIAKGSPEAPCSCLTHGKNGVPELPAVVDAPTVPETPTARDEARRLVAESDVVAGNVDALRDRCGFLARRAPCCCRLGCSRDAAEDSLFCSGHRAAADAVTPDLDPIGAAFAAAGELARKRARVAVIFEHAWRFTADRDDLDPRTVALCKLLRDAEVSS
jgi:hypothetical protein